MDCISRIQQNVDISSAVKPGYLPANRSRNINRIYSAIFPDFVNRSGIPHLTSRKCVRNVSARVFCSISRSEVRTLGRLRDNAVSLRHAKSWGDLGGQIVFRRVLVLRTALSKRRWSRYNF